MREPVFASVPPTDPVIWWRALCRVYLMIDEKNLGLISAGVAFYAILAVFPGLAATISLWGIVGDPGVALVQLEEFQGVIPGDVYKLLSAQLSKLAQADGLTLGWASFVSLMLALWPARAGVGALIRGLNEIYDTPNPSGIARQLRALLLTFGLIGVALVALASIVVLPFILAVVPLGRWTSYGVDAVRWALGIGVLWAGFGLIYRLGPNLGGARPRMISPGVVFAIVGWIAASKGFTIYLQNFGTYNEVYGSIGAVIAMLMWLFISAYLILLGGALNAELARARRAKLAIPEPPATPMP